MQLVGGLFQQFAAVGQDQHPVPGAHLVFGHGSKHNGFAGAGGQHQQRAQPPLFPLCMDLFFRPLLIGAEGEKVCVGHKYPFRVSEELGVRS